MKYKRAFDSKMLPCGNTVHAERDAGGRLWELEKKLDSGEETYDMYAYIETCSIPELVKFLTKLYYNTPERYRK